MAYSPHRQIPQITDQERARILAEINAHGEHRTASRLGVARVTMTRALARLPLQRGSLLLIRVGLASLDPSSAPAAA